MRQDILSRKQELKRAGAKASAHGARASPLDDPVILVQNLPDYEVIEPPLPSTASSGNSEVMSSLQPASENVRTQGEGDGSESDNDASDADATEEPAAPANLEFARMVLQLKSVVECSDLDDEPSDDDDESESNDSIPHAPTQPRIPEENDDEDERSTEAACAPLPPAYGVDDALPKSFSPSTLKCSTLEDPSFMKSLRALLSTARASGAENTENAILASESSVERRQILVWMRDYISTLTATDGEKMQ